MGSIGFFCFCFLFGARVSLYSPGWLRLPDLLPQPPASVTRTGHLYSLKYQHHPCGPKLTSLLFMELASIHRSLPFSLIQLRNRVPASDPAKLSFFLALLSPSAMCCDLAPPFPRPRALPFPALEDPVICFPHHDFQATGKHRKINQPCKLVPPQIYGP